MREDFLHYIWRFKKFDFLHSKTELGEELTILDPGKANMDSGPDFFNARIKIGNQQWAGNVEIHLKSSDWYLHNHQADPAYDTVILHVVWEHDVEIFRKDNVAIPVLELKKLVSEQVLQNYRNLLLAPNSKWINCEQDFAEFTDLDIENWLERVYLEKLQKKAEMIKGLLVSSHNNWEETLFKLLCKNFGLNINGGAFLRIAESIDFKIVQKSASSNQILEALFLGQAGMLEESREDAFYKQLQKEYGFLKNKFSLENSFVERPKYFRLRPSNFPNIRLAQLAAVYSRTNGLFAEIMKADERDKINKIFTVTPSEYWQYHYTFGKKHNFKKKGLSEAFIELLLINTIIPLKFCYFQETGNGDVNELLEILQNIRPEANRISNQFNKLRPHTPENALHSQALIYLKKEYCDKNNCLHCNLGVKVLQGAI